MTLPVPDFTIPDPTSDNARAQAWSMLTAKYADAGAWAIWAADLMNTRIADMEASLGADTVEADIAALAAEIGTIVDSHPGTIAGTGAGFSDALLTALKGRLETDIATYSTGLGTAEAAMFSRETARVTAERAIAYNEVTTTFSSRGFDMPPGGVAAKQTEASNESSKRLTDSSGKILEESARLAVQYNLGIINASAQLIDALAKIYESEETRKFEASKATVMLAVENYRSTLGLVTAKADIVLKKGELALGAKARQLALEVETFRALALGAQQMIAGAMNGISASASFGFAGHQNQVLNTTA